MDIALQEENKKCRHYFSIKFQFLLQSSRHTNVTDNEAFLFASTCGKSQVDVVRIALTFLW